MKSATIFKKLREYLKPEHVGRLELMHSLAPELAMVLTMADVIREYNSTEEDEKEVSLLLEHLAKNHFSTPKKSPPPAIPWKRKK
ncbi:MAG TPA: hypothetical protein VKU83_11580 [Puia sp.]|nr:hypothetical protein [Puia sp.]